MSQNNEIIKKAKADWNAQADKFNQWDVLGTDEKLELVASAALAAQAGQPTTYEQSALELCGVCGWKALIPTDCCLNCEREKQLQVGQGEPVAQVVVVSVPGGGKGKVIRATPDKWILTAPEGTKLYTGPASVRQPLTDEQIENISNADNFWDDHFGYSTFDCSAFARAIEAAHGIKP
ncbi:MAG: hypothetical protein K2X64_12170 [Rhodocyclaceae bacterium]|nr:hypothetical protein [Rhodocyclaceae bacterium]